MDKYLTLDSFILKIYWRTSFYTFALLRTSMDLKREVLGSVLVYSLLFFDYFRFFNFFILFLLRLLMLFFLFSFLFLFSYGSEQRLRQQHLKFRYDAV